MKITILLLLILVFTFASFGQDKEYGKPEELKGLVKIFIDTKSDVVNRNLITKEIEKAKLPGIEFVAAQDAQIFLVFQSYRKDVFYGIQPTTPIYGTNQRETTKADIKSFNAGGGYVAIKGNDNAKRILASYDSVQDRIGKKSAAVKFAKEFIKAYKMANDLK